MGHLAEANLNTAMYVYEEMSKEQIKVHLIRFTLVALTESN